MNSVSCDYEVPWKLTWILLMPLTSSQIISLPNIFLRTPSEKTFQKPFRKDAANLSKNIIAEELFQ